MKKFLRFLVIALLLVFIASCEPTEKVGKSPEIHGAEDQVIEKGSIFVPLEGITASDEEDGDLTDKVKYTGDVNPNREGIYEAIYTVTDSDGNLTKVKIKVEVIVRDTEPPLLSGVADKEIMVGDETFHVTKDVTANDIIDGDLTDEIVVSGEVDVWTPGEYTLTYEVSDKSDNKTTRERVVTVGLGYFEFSNVSAIDENPANWDLEGVSISLENGNLVIEVTSDGKLSFDISGGYFNEAIADFSYAMLVFKAKANEDREANISLEDATYSIKPIELTTTFTEHTRYFKFSEVLEDSKFVIELGTEIGNVEVESFGFYFAEASDTEAPVIVVPEHDVYAPVNNLEAITKLVLRGVTASDNIDGNLTSKLALDLSEIDITKLGEVEIPIVVEDGAGNEARETRTVYLNAVFDTNVIKDPEFNDDLDETQWALSGGGEGVTLYNEGGMMVVDIVEPGGWDSATSPYLRGITTNHLLPNNWYMFKFDVKAETARQLRMRAGLEFYTDPWIDDFLGGQFLNLQYQVTTDWTTIYYVFYVDKDRTPDSNVVKFEIKLGTITLGSEEKNNRVFIDNAQFYLLTTEDEEPVISKKPGVVTTFAAGSEEPDWKEFVEIFDLEDGAIEVTDDMIDASLVDMSKEGTFDVIYTVTDSGGNTTIFNLTITIIEDVDEEAPVLTVTDLLPFEFDQFEDVEVDLKAYVTAIDNVDGEIVITAAMIDSGGFDISKAGVYEIKYTVADSSGNVAEVQFEIEVFDKEAPKLVGKDEYTLLLGEVFDPLSINVVDNVDGKIELTIDDVSGYEDFLDEENVVEAAGEFTLSYVVSDEAGNIAEFEIEITVIKVEYDHANKKDLLGLELPINNDGSVESTGVYEDGILTVTYNGTKGWYASYSKLKYTELNLNKGYYEFIIEGKAEHLRDILIYFIDGNNKAVGGFEGKRLVTLEEGYEVHKAIFEIETSGSYSLEAQFGWEGFLTNAANPNVMTFKEISITPLIPEGEEPEPPQVPFVIDDINVSSQEELNLLFWHRYNSTNYHDECVTYAEDQGYLGSPAVKFTYGLKINNGWDILRSAGTINQEGLTNEYEYFVFWFKPVEEISSVYVWLYWAGSQDSKAVDVSHIGPEGGFVAVKLSNWSKQALDITGYGIAMNYPSKVGSFYIDQVMFVVDPLALLPEEEEEPAPQELFVIDDINVESQEELYELFVHRYNGANYKDEAVLYAEDEGYLSSPAVKFTYGLQGRINWDILRSVKTIDQEGLTNDYKYFVFWFKPVEEISTIHVWLYWSESQNSVAVDVSHIGPEGGFVAVKVSDWGKNALDITGYGIAVAYPEAVGSFYIDQVMFVIDPEALLPEEEEPEPQIPFILSDVNVESQEELNALFWHRYGGANYHDDCMLYVEDEGYLGSPAIKFTYGEKTSSGWDLVRFTGITDKEGLTNDYKYFVFWFKPVEEISSIYIWLYWAGSQDSKEVDVSHIGLEGGFVAVPISNWSKQALDIIDFAFGMNNPKTVGSFYIDQVMFMIEPYQP